MKLASMMMVAVAGLSACVEEAPEPAESAESADGEGAAAPLDPAALSEHTSQLTDAEAAAAIPVAAAEIVRVRLYYGELVYSAPVAQEPSDVTGGPPSTVRTVISQEISRPDSAGVLRSLAATGSPLEEYLTVTSAQTPVPYALLQSEPPGPIRDRAMQRTIATAPMSPVTGLSASQLGALVTSHGTASSMCSGTTSASFAANVCTLVNWDVDFCHNGTWFSVTDGVGSSNKKRDSRSYTLACGANGRVRHYYKAGGVWYKPIDEPIPSGQLLGWQKSGNWALQREITHSRTASGFVRGSSHFNIPF